MKMRLIFFISCLKNFRLFPGKRDTHILHGVLNSVQPGLVDRNLSALAEQKHFRASFPKDPVKQLRIRQRSSKTKFTRRKQRFHLAVQRVIYIKNQRNFFVHQIDSFLHFSTLRDSIIIPFYVRICNGFFERKRRKKRDPPVIDESLQFQIQTRNQS